MQHVHPGTRAALTEIYGKGCNIWFSYVLTNYTPASFQEIMNSVTVTNLEIDLGSMPFLHPIVGKTPEIVGLRDTGTDREN